LEGIDVADNKQKARRSPAEDSPTLEPHPEKIDVDDFGPWIMKRDRQVFSMLEEYDRRTKKTSAETE
jgi:hypothetical protein